MSTYGDQPQNPYGQQPPNPYGGPADPYAGQPGYGAPVSYASWIKRVGARFVDGLLGMLAALPVIVGLVMLLSTAEERRLPNGQATVELNPGAAPFVVMGLGFVLSFAFTVWNLYIRQGRTGQTLGKSALGISLVKEDTGRPIGAGMSFVRQLAHVLDSLPCYLGFLWPIWDAKNQTFADKVLSTVVVDKPKG